jgi:SAM-dependent methyltransferase
MTMNITPGRIEILSVLLLKAHQTLVEEFRQISGELNIGLGWHYLLDLSWSIQRLALSRGMRVIDAGAGIGVMQWWLAGHGVDVISVDCMSRHNLSMRLRQRYRIQGLRKKDLAPLCGNGVRGFLPPRSPLRWHLYPQKLATSLRQWWENPPIPPSGGTVFIYNENLACMPDIPDNSVDAVVSISALEHNAPNPLRACVAELMRVLKPGGKLIATLGAAKHHDWFHEPSKGWCYTDATLRQIFELSADCPSNYDCYDELFEALRNSSELRENLADFYFKSGHNGMPWGIWDPKYQPVGVVKVKNT